MSIDVSQSTIISARSLLRTYDGGGVMLQARASRFYLFCGKGSEERLASTSYNHSRSISLADCARSRRNASASIVSRFPSFVSLRRKDWSVRRSSSMRVLLGNMDFHASLGDT